MNNGIARRSWARNEGAMFAIKREMERTPGLKVTLPNLADDKLVRKAIDEVNNRFGLLSVRLLPDGENAFDWLKRRGFPVRRTREHRKTIRLILSINL